MENNSKIKNEMGQGADAGKTENDLNADILKITMRIKDQYPELSKYVDEMTVVIPDEKDPGITLRNLRSYYDSLSAMLNKYILEHNLQEIK